jgi:type I restriction enzyme S subunit
MEAVVNHVEEKIYRSYKDSGIKWLGDLPSHWGLLSNKYIFNLKKNPVGKRSNEYVLLSLTLTGVIKRNMINPQGKFPAEFDTYQEVNKGDFIFCLFDVEETPRTVGLSDFDGMITGAYTVLQPKYNFDKRYLYYFYLNLDTSKRLKPLYTGLRNTISKENFFSFKTFVPPPPEQTAIARFLDRKTAQIDKAIAQKEKLIELLKERRQILIHNAVTKGLNPNVKMKDSGVEWIGEIPEHWRVMKMTHILFLLVDGTHASPKSFNTGEYKYVTAKNIKEEGFDFSEITYLNEKDHKVIYRRCPVKKDDVLYIKDGATAGVATINTLDEEFSLLSSVALLRVIKNTIDAKFLSHYLNSEIIKRYVLTRIVGGAITRLTLELIGNFKVIIPPHTEQKAISSRIEQVNFKTSTAISWNEKAIQRLKEYKATLINSAVTGKIKVPDLETMD